MYTHVCVTRVFSIRTDKATAFFGENKSRAQNNVFSKYVRVAIQQVHVYVHERVSVCVYLLEYYIYIYIYIYI